MCGLAVVGMDGCRHADIHSAVFYFFIMIPTKESHSALVRKEVRGRNQYVFFKCLIRGPDARGPTRGSAEINSGVMLLAGPASGPFLAGHDLTRPARFSSPPDPTRPDPIR